MIRWLGFLAGLGLAMTAQTETTRPFDFGRKTAPVREWAIAAGEVGIEFHRGLTDDLGLVIGVEGELRGARHWLPMRDLGSIAFTAPYGLFERFSGGSLVIDGGLSFGRAGRALSLRDLRLRPVVGSSERIELVDSGGVVWFYTSHAHFDFVEDGRRLRIFNLDLHPADAFIRWFGDDHLRGAVLGQLELNAPVTTRGEILAERCSNPRWPNAPLNPGGPPYYEADVLMEALGAWSPGGCTPSGACDGPGGANSGRVKFTPSATLRNSNRPNTADIPWYRKFSGIFAPYNNDQHPFLIWNTYRLDPDGTFVQIGRSGVKHAFLTINSGCAEPCGNNQILGRGCADVYGVGNNDSNNDLGTRTDIIAAAGRWGRCGSIWDPDCDGASNNPGITSFQYRNLVPEQELEDRGGSEFLFDGWYLVRDDVDIYNTMGWRRWAPSYSSGTWLAPAGSLGPFTLGSVMERFVPSTTTSPRESHERIKVPEGHLIVAGKALPLGDSLWRYVIAVYNYDFGRPQIDPAQPNDPNMRLFRNLGFAELRLPLVVPVSNAQFLDGDGVAANDWSISSAGGELRFRAPPGSGGAPASNSLDWGTMFTFVFESAVPPAPIDARPELRLGIADPGTPSELLARVVAPAAQGDFIFASGFR